MSMHGIFRPQDMESTLGNVIDAYEYAGVETAFGADRTELIVDEL
ncbi:hypothetical protein QEJ61_gp22 [Curtobacterium phage Pize]|nr:hypothetical protein QEJ61_gp22 [Curtobacterium phage Pize]QXG07754.1 hypothetical protein [Curtobacterium phage Pize]